MVVVEKKRKHENVLQGHFFRRHSASADSRLRDWSLLKLEPAVDVPVQLNFGSPYSSSVTIFFDFEENSLSMNKRSSQRISSERKLLSSKSFPGNFFR